MYQQHVACYYDEISTASNASNALSLQTDTSRYLLMNVF